MEIRGDDMKRREKPVEIEKTFGIRVLLKLTRTNVEGIKISEKDGRLTSNVSLNELSRAVDATVESHNIRLKAS